MALLPRRRPGGTPPRLLLRFAVLTATAMLVAGAVIFTFVRRDATHRAERNAGFHARFVADTIMREGLRPADFERPATGARRAQLDEFMRTEVLDHGVLRAKLYRPDSLVTYSTTPTLIGTNGEPDEIEEVMHGRTITDVSRLNGEGGGGPATKILESYAPVRLRGGARPAGVFEVYQDYAPIAADARSAFVPIAMVIGAVLLGLYILLFPILRRVTLALRRHVDEIRHHALHDALTGLPNRALFRDRVDRALALGRRHAHGATVMLLDLDRFKEVNDTLGHQKGDLLLEEVGRRLAGLLRESDTVARLGGDEFAVLSPTTDDIAGALALADRIRGELERPLALDGLSVQVDASIGIALFPEHGTDVETLIRHADVAMYASKEAHAPTLYAPEHDHYSPERLALVGDLRRALDDGGLTLYYQPLASVEQGRVVAVEALARWQHPERGLLVPADFIPLAEHTGLIRPLTRHVLDAALRQAREWADDGFDVRVAVNVSGRDLMDPRLCDEVRELLQAHGVPPRRLELEISENTILTDPGRARALLDRLNRLGVRIAIDDFGAGYSSLGYLKRLPIDALKIDKSFVIDMDVDQDDAVIVRSTIELGHNLGMEVVAEGVETAAAWSELSALGCDIAQGYYLGRPVPAAEVAAVLARRERLPAGR
jgi:diguanylate cyclase (GGDEF)-like protein